MERFGLTPSATEVFESSGMPDPFFEDPYPFYRELRDKAPLYKHEASGLVFLTRHADIRRALFDPGTFSSARGNVLADSPQRVGRTLGSMDPPRHDQLRVIVMKGFSRERIQMAMDELRAEAKARIETLKDGPREMDFVQDFSRPLLYASLGRMLGLDAVAARRAADALGTMFKGDVAGPLGPPMPESSMTVVMDLMREQIARRRENLSDDLFSVLIEAQQNRPEMTDDAIMGNMSTVLLAGNASVGHFFPNFIVALHKHPDVRRRVLDDPSLLAHAFDEAVRWDTSTQCFARQVEKDVEVEGGKLVAGQRVVLFYAAANRDERAIESADVFDIDRRRCQHFGFGSGVHFCLGSNVAKAMILVLSELLLPLIGEYDLDLAAGRRVRHIMVRGHSTLPMRWN